MLHTLNLRIDPKTAATPELLKRYIASELKLDMGRIIKADIVRRSVDARQRRVMVNLTVQVHVDKVETLPPYPLPEYKPVAEDAREIIVVGAGPAGLFAALALIENGFRPIVLERGKDVDSRRKDLAGIARTNTIDPDSNYAFGEGGAGAYSDGKLYTRSKKRGDTDKILHILHKHGASKDILIDAHPHIGTNRLPDIIKNIRHTIESCGGKVYFQTRVTGLITDATKTKVTGVTTHDGKEFFGPVILATGHSARDVYHLLQDSGITLQAKGIAVGVRLEHPAELIDRLQYHSREGKGKYLPTAEYSKLTRIDDRAVYSFCMCPGGVIVPAGTGPGQLVVNGMSAANRGSRWSNSGMVVEVLPEDIPGEDVLRVMHFQEKIEKDFYEDAGATQNAGAQRMTDFVEGKPSVSLPPTSYAPGIHPTRMDKLLPQSIAARLRKGFLEFDRKQPGFLSPEGVLIGAETRTSSPVRIPRDSDTLQHIDMQGLYPCGEGAGYAGGIVSAAIDGERCAAAAIKNFS